MSSFIKKQFIFILASIFSLFLFTQVVFAASGKLILSTPSASVTSGSEFNITLFTDTSVAISGLLADVSYNPGQLEYMSYSEYGTAFPELWSQTPESGKVSTVRSTSGTDVSGKKVVITYRFKALAKNGETTLVASGKANASGSELGLSQTSLKLNFVSSTQQSANNSSSPVTSTSSDTAPSSLSNGSSTDGDNANTESNNLTGSLANQTAIKPQTGVKGVLEAINPISAFSDSGNKESRLGFIFIGLAIMLIVVALVFKKLRHSAQLAGHFPDIHSSLFTPEEMAQSIPKDTHPPNSTDDSSIPPAVGNAYNPADTVVIRPQTIQPSSSTEPSGTIQSPAPTIHHDFAQPTPPTITPTPAGQTPPADVRPPTSGSTLINPDETAN